MKAILLLITSVLIISCSLRRDIQMSMVEVELIKIDTVVRYPNVEEMILTWRTGNNINYVTFESVRNYYVLGSKIMVMVPR